ncbi:SPOR domain-containing protein [bacterium]|nr:SPOR domain-containing protein [bacterium]
MDKFKENNIEPALVVKLVLILVILLTVAFVSGVVIGKNGRRNIDRTSSDEDGINEKLSNCIFNLDELRGKYLKLRNAAREKGLLDENDAVNAKIVCSVAEQKPVAAKPDEKSVETLHETSPAEKPDEPEPAETKPAEPKSIESKSVETFHETPLHEKPKPDKNKTIDEILSEKGVSPQKETSRKETVKKCRFSIQIFAASTKEQADAAAKKLKSLKPRTVSGENNGKNWYKLRTGCFDSREAAEAELPRVRKSEKSAYIVAE